MFDSVKKLKLEVVNLRNSLEAYRRENLILQDEIFEMQKDIIKLKNLNIPEDKSISSSSTNASIDTTYLIYQV